MRTLNWRQITAFSVLLLGRSSAIAQITDAPPSTDSGLASQSPQGWQAIARDWSSTEWRMVQGVTNSVTGQSGGQVHSYVEVANGINYLDTTGLVPVWKPSADAIYLMTNGSGAAALRGPTRVYFPAVLTTIS